MPLSTALIQHQTFVLPYFLFLFPFQFWLFTSFPFPGKYISDYAIVCLSSTIIMIVWKIAKCLIEKLTFAKNTSLNLWNDLLSAWPLTELNISNNEPVTSFGKWGLSWLIIYANDTPGCRSSLVTFDAFISNLFFDSNFLVVIYCSVSSFRFLHFHLFVFPIHAETVAVGVDPYFSLMPWCWTTKTRLLQLPKFVGLIFVN